MSAVIIRAGKKHLKKNRSFQGIPSIGISPKGRLFACWYTGGEWEGPGNYTGIVISDDRAETWTDFEWIVTPTKEHSRVFDQEMWLSPDNTLYLFWTETNSNGYGDIFDGASGVWFSVLKNPDSPIAEFQWSAPRRMADGVMMDKPTVLADGTWVFPVALWNINRDRGDLSARGAKIYVSTDHGKTFQERGKTLVDEKHATFDEHAIVELPDGRLKMLIRTLDGYHESFSSDKGISWTTPVHSPWLGPNSRPCFIKLKSGAFMMAGNDSHTRREMKAFYSADGIERMLPLMIDERDETSYPDAIQDADGTIYLIHDRSRARGGFIYVSRFHEDDLKAGSLVNADSMIGIEISHTHPVKA